MFSKPTRLEPLIPVRQRFVAFRLLVIGAGWGLLAAPFFWRGIFSGDGPILCTLRAVTGLPCPGCGLTRAFCALSELDFWKAIQFNLVALPLAMLALLVPVVAATELLSGRPYTWYRSLVSAQTAKWVALLLVVYHATRLAVWAADGTLVEVYLKSGGIYKFLQSNTGL